MLHEDPGSNEPGVYDDPAYGNMMMRMGSPFYAAFAKYVRNSPLLNLASAKTPTLIIQGEEDGFADGERVFNTLYRLGVDAQLLYYWGEGHTIEGPGNVRNMTAQTVAWLLEHLSLQEHDLPLATVSNSPSANASSE
jgi:dipeptidyl aminopeptidase/acylaminoacyl peptidase